jgi:hypothetical protein
MIVGAILTALSGGLFGAVLSIAGYVGGLYAINGIFDWLLGGKLVCLAEGERDYEIAIGTVTVIEPPLSDIWEGSNIDNDYSWNILLAPYEIYYTQADLVANLNALASDPGAAPVFSLPTFSTQTPYPPLDRLAKETASVKQLRTTYGANNIAFTGQEGSVNYPILHCEIEGSRIFDMRQAFETILAMTTLASILIPALALLSIPVVGWFLAFLAFLAWLIASGLAYLDGWYNGGNASPGDGGIANNTDPPANGSLSFQDIVLVYGKWVYDAGHSPNAGSNEIHPVLLLQKLSGLPNLNTISTWEGLIKDGTSVQTILNQADNQNDWALNPSVDGNTPGPVPPLQ